MRNKHFPRRDNFDYISFLSTKLLCLIISFLPFKDAVATSVLSKRWRYVYASLPSLDFNYSDFPRERGRKHAFIEFIENMIKQFENSELRRFCLSMQDYGGHEPRVENWINFAVEKEIEELEIELPRGRLTKIPDSVFQCTSIISLKLRMHRYAFELPSFVGLNNLKFLLVQSISFIKEEFFKELFKSCLDLQELVIVECKIEGIDIDSPSLENLEICHCNWSNPIEIKISAPNLRSFKYIGAIANKHYLRNLTSLVEVDLTLKEPISKFESSHECLSELIDLACMVGNAKVLTLSPWCIDKYCRVMCLPERLNAQRENVKELVLQLDMWEDCVHLVLPILLTCVNVEILSIEILHGKWLKNGQYNTGGDEDQEEKESMKKAIKNLKSVKLVHIDKGKKGLELIMLLLRNASVLDKMVIVPHGDGLESAEFEHNVFSFDKASQKAQIEYCASG